MTEQNSFSNAQRAQVLTQALPYIRKYSGKIVVVKYGGNAMVNEELKHQVMEDIVLLWLIGIRVVLVHGGGPEISELMDRLGKSRSSWTGCGSRTARPLTSCRWCWREKSTRAL